MTRGPRFPQRLADATVAARVAGLGAALGLVLTPPMAAVWAFDPPNTGWEGMPWVPRTFGPTLASWGALSFGRAELGPYEVYGKFFFLVYLSMLPVAYVAHQRYLAGGGRSRGEKWTWRAMWSGLVLATVGDFTTYWGLSVSGRAGQLLWSNGFGIEILAVMFLLLPGTILYAVLALWQHQLPGWAALLLLSWIPMCVATLAYVTLYVPNAVIVPLSLIWVAIGWGAFARTSSEAPSRPPL